MYKHFIPFRRLPFYFLDGFLCCAEIFSLTEPQLVILAFVDLFFGLGEGRNSGPKLQS